MGSFSVTEAVVTPFDNMGTNGPEGALKAAAVPQAFLDAIEKQFGAQKLEPRPPEKPLTAKQRAALAEALKNAFAPPPDRAAKAAVEAQKEANASGRPVLRDDVMYLPRTPQEQRAQDALDAKLRAAQEQANRTGKPVGVDGFYLLSPESKKPSASPFQKLLVEFF